MRGWDVNFHPCFTRRCLASISQKCTGVWTAAASAAQSRQALVSRTVSAMRKTSGAALGKTHSPTREFGGRQTFFPVVIRHKLRLSYRLSETRSGEICNACVLLVKRWKKLPVGTKKNWNHVGLDNISIIYDSICSNYVRFAHSWCFLFTSP